MPASEVVAMPTSEMNQKPQQIASWGHFAGFLAIMGGMVAMGFYAQHAAGTASAVAHPPAQRR